MPAEPLIRTATAHDAEALSALRVRAAGIWPAYGAALAREAEGVPSLAIEQGRIRLANDADAGEPRGFSHSSLGPRGEWQIEGVFVDPPRTRQGIGTALLSDVIALARADGAPRVGTIALPEVVPFFESAGFGAAAPIPTSYGSAVRMWCPLGPLG